MDETDDVQNDNRERDAELDGLRIRQLSAMRRAAYRSRSYAIIAAVVALMASVQFAWMAFDHVRAIGLRIRPIAFSLLGIVALLGAVYFVRKATALHREARQSLLSEPATPPDFSTLSDGSQHVRYLESMGDEHERAG